MTPVTMPERLLWRQLRREGLTIREIAAMAERHWNTVDRHVSDHSEARQRADGVRKRLKRKANLIKAQGCRP